MKIALVAAGIAASLTVAAAQETKVPEDSALVSISGCAKNGNFIVGERREDQPGTLEIAPGRRFRLQGPKKLLSEIKAHQRSTVEVTGLIRKADLSARQGVGVLGGRVRIGGSPVPQSAISDPALDPAYNQAVLDVRSWRAVAGECR